MLKRICFSSNLIYFLVVSLFVVLRICSNFGVFSSFGMTGSYVIGAVTQVGLLLLIPLLLFKVLNKFSFKETLDVCCFKKISWKMVLFSVLLGGVVFCLNIYVSSFFNGIIQFFGYKPRGAGESLPPFWWTLLVDLLCTAILPAVCEETLHRGILMRGNAGKGLKKSIIISGVLFGLLHLNVEQFFYATAIGLFLGYLCWCCDSIYPCMIIHFMNNGISVFLTFASDKGWAVGNVLPNITSFLNRNLVGGMFLFVLVFLILLAIAFELTQALTKESFNFHFQKRQRELANLAIRENYFKQIEDIKNDQYVETTLPQKKVIYIDLKEFLEGFSKNMENACYENTEKCRKMEILTKIFMWGSIALSAIVTFMTFIWGILR